MTSPLYLASIALLVVNDLWLKYAWPGLVTGKLSDVAGLFAFAVFWSTITRRPALSCSAVAAAFVLWKSPLSRPLLEWLPVTRVEDPTDLLALAVLPFAYWHSTRPDVPFRPAAARVLIAVFSIAAFANTSVPRHRFDLAPDTDPLQVQIAMPLDQAVARLKKCGLHASVSEVDAIDRPATYLHLGYKTRAITPPRHISFIATVTSRDPLILEGGNLSIQRQPSAGNENVVRDDFRARLGDCLGEAVTYGVRTGSVER